MRRKLIKMQFHLLNDDELEMLVDEINYMKKDIVEKNQNLVEQRNRLKIVLEKIGYSIVIIDKNYHLIDMNSRGGCFGNYFEKPNAQGSKCYNLFLGKEQPCKAAGREEKLRRKCSIIEFSLSPMTRSNILKMMKR